MFPVAQGLSMIGEENNHGVFIHAQLPHPVQVIPVIVQGRTGNDNMVGHRNVPAVPHKGDAALYLRVDRRAPLGQLVLVYAAEDSALAAVLPAVVIGSAFHVPIVCGFAPRLAGRFEYELTATDVIWPEDWADRDDPLFYITARFNRAMEIMICRAPDQYLWVHRRWKSRPRHERLGRPMPRRLIARLQSLPWLTPAEVDRLVRSSSPGAAAT